MCQCDVWRWFCLFCLALLFLVELNAISANSFVVELLFIYDVPLYHLLFGHLGCLLIEEVNHFSTFLAEEMNMRSCVSVVTHTMLVNGNHLSSIFLAHHSQRIIYCSLAECRYSLIQFLVDIIDSRMNRMRQEIIHDSNSLNRRTDIAFDKSIVCHFAIIHILLLFDFDCKDRKNF